MPWTFLTNQVCVLICLAVAHGANGQGAVTARAIAHRPGLIERAVQRIIDNLAAAGYMAARREGRCNVSTVRRDLSLRSALLPERTVGAAGGGADLRLVGPAAAAFWAALSQRRAAHQDAPEG